MIIILWALNEDEGRGWLLGPLNPAYWRSEAPKPNSLSGFSEV